MAEVREEIIVHAPPAVVWRLAGDPGRIGEWLPALEGSSLDGTRRSCTLQDGGRVVEQITEHSDEGRFYTYEIVESPLPLRSYESRLELNRQGEHTRVVWTAELEAAADGNAEELGSGFAEIHRTGLESLRAAVESEVRAAVEIEGAT